MDHAPGPKPITAGATAALEKLSSVSWQGVDQSAGNGGAGGPLFPATGPSDPGVGLPHPRQTRESVQLSRRRLWAPVMEAGLASLQGKLWPLPAIDPPTLPPTPCTLELTPCSVPPPPPPPAPGALPDQGNTEQFSLPAWTHAARWASPTLQITTAATTAASNQKRRTPRTYPLGERAWSNLAGRSRRRITTAARC